MTSTSSTASNVTTNVTKPHRNYFSGIIGFGSWDVTRPRPRAIAGTPNAAIGAMPLLFNEAAFPKGPGPRTRRPSTSRAAATRTCPRTRTCSTGPCTARPRRGNGGCNGDSSTVDDLIDNRGDSTRVSLDDDIGPLNAGAHTTLFSALARSGRHEFPVAIVDDDGGLVGWAMFHLTGSVGGSTKQIRGYFVSPVNFRGVQDRPGRWHRWPVRRHDGAPHQIAERQNASSDVTRRPAWARAGRRVDASPEPYDPSTYGSGGS